MMLPFTNEGFTYNPIANSAGVTIFLSLVTWYGSVHSLSTYRLMYHGN